MKKNYKERRHQKPKVKGPSQTRRINHKAFKAFAKAWVEKFGVVVPEALPEGYTERDFCRAAGIETRATQVLANPGGGYAMGMTRRVVK